MFNIKDVMFPAGYTEVDMLIGIFLEKDNKGRKCVKELRM